MIKDNKATDKVLLSNILADGVNVMKVLAGSVISFAITVLCAFSDYLQLNVLLDSVQNEDELLIIVSTCTLVLFLNFSLYVAAHVIKDMNAGKYVGDSRAMSLVCIGLSFALFIVLFSISFKFKYELRDHLFSAEALSGGDSLANKAAVKIAQTLTPAANEDQIIKLAAILCGLMPAATSILSLLSVFLLYDPQKSDTASTLFKLMYYKYRSYLTEKRQTSLSADIDRLEQLPTAYGDLIAGDYYNYLVYGEDVKKMEVSAKRAEYSAAIEIFSGNPDVVTMLSDEAAGIKERNALSPGLSSDKKGDKLPAFLQNSIDDAKKIFSKNSSTFDSPSAKGGHIDGTMSESGGSAAYSGSEAEDEYPAGYIAPYEGSSDGWDDDETEVFVPDSAVSPQLKGA